jgi:hypothetical protein
MSALSKWFGRVIRRELRRFDAEHGLSAIERAQLRLALQATPRFQDDKRLLKFEHQVFSQGGEDGIVREIFRRIGVESRRFVEFGVGDGLENNTAFLLQQGWSGVWIEGDGAHGAAIRSKFKDAITDDRLTLVVELVTADNAINLVPARARDEPLDLLSIDLDRSTFAIWQSLASLRPRVVVIEYNAVWPADFDYAVPYSASSVWNGSSHFGASLKAIERHARATGYSLVGCDAAGANAFLVRDDLIADHFCAPFTSENHYEPIRYCLHGKDGHRRDVVG